MKDAVNAVDRNGADEPTVFVPPAIVDYGDVAKETHNNSTPGGNDGIEGYS